MTDVVRKRDIWTLAIKGVAKDQPPRQRRDGWFFDNTFLTPYPSGVFSLTLLQAILYNKAINNE
jgi:hypothetical protein